MMTEETTDLAVEGINLPPSLENDFLLLREVDRHGVLRMSTRRAVLGRWFQGLEIKDRAVEIRL